MLFSATFPRQARELAKTYLADDHVRFRVGRAGSTVVNIRQTVMHVENPQKKNALISLIQEVPPCRTIIFVNSIHMAEELDDFLFNIGLPCTSMHSARSQLEREASLRAFRAGRAPILIATGITARGIDVRNVHHVINFDMPSMDHGGIEEYTHRIGKCSICLLPFGGGLFVLALGGLTNNSQVALAALENVAWLLLSGPNVTRVLPAFLPVLSWRPTRTFPTFWSSTSPREMRSITSSSRPTRDWEEYEAAMTGGVGGDDAWGNEGGGEGITCDDNDDGQTAEDQVAIPTDDDAGWGTNDAMNDNALDNSGAQAADIGDTWTTSEPTKPRRLVDGLFASVFLAKPARPNYWDPCSLGETLGLSVYAGGSMMFPSQTTGIIVLDEGIFGWGHTRL